MPIDITEGIIIIIIIIIIFTLPAQACGLHEYTSQTGGMLWLSCEAKDMAVSHRLLRKTVCRQSQQRSAAPCVQRTCSRHNCCWLNVASCC
jgi:hypothetical protein